MPNHNHLKPLTYKLLVRIEIYAVQHRFGVVDGRHLIVSVYVGIPNSGVVFATAECPLLLHTSKICGGQSCNPLRIAAKRAGSNGCLLLVLAYDIVIRAYIHNRSKVHCNPQILKLFAYVTSHFVNELPSIRKLGELLLFWVTYVLLKTHSRTPLRIYGNKHRNLGFALKSVHPSNYIIDGTVHNNDTSRSVFSYKRVFKSGTFLIRLWICIKDKKLCNLLSYRELVHKLVNALLSFSLLFALGKCGKGEKKQQRYEGYLFHYQ